ncbi:MAG: CAP domain-containing protein [Ardenticatenia bacterium]|nr:CAP domain-containing protein [Ardenticatenia bacterium]
MRGVVVCGLLLLLTGWLAASPLHATVYSGYDPAQHPAERVVEEALTVYWGNVARQQNGVAPLRWNRQLTHAARWFSWDSTENRPPGFCGHQDTLGTWPIDRTRAFGYLGRSGAENAYCGYLAPKDAIDGWMASPGHRANLLDPNSREVGIGYYRRDSDGRGYIAQNFGADTAFAPVIVANEALTTTNPTVPLYIYQSPEEHSFAGRFPATEMMIGEDVCLAGATWQPFTSEVSWTLSERPGWKTVYVKTRDRFGRTHVVSDTIYLGASLPIAELDRMGPASRSSTVTLPVVDSRGLPYLELSLGWLADDSFESFTLLWGNGERVDDPLAWGGTAYRLFPGNGESFAWVYDTTFYKNIPMVAYVRLKVNDNTSSEDVARFEVSGGGVTYGPLRIRGTDFDAPNVYQEFRLPFVFHENADDPFLIFKFWRLGTADVYVDAVSIFTAPQPVSTPFVWQVPGGNYRGQGVWGRFSDG